ncbi:uncharacterized protein LOC127264070 [Andrographis paniculata]|uniref:uncharacterized protein LOC127264070 n=1 Tax=Andrographis paniculata TaxID=175694 RepID=UPI0021E7BFFA|nr:uncharacterized protein LOC127264070 [Andrographis paniculata]
MKIHYCFSGISNMLETYFTTRCLCKVLKDKMFRFCSLVMASVFASIVEVVGFVSRYWYRSRPCVAEESGSIFSGNHSQEENNHFGKESIVFWSSGPSGRENLDVKKKGKKSFSEEVEDTEGSDFLRTGLISNSSKYEFMSGKDVCGFLEEPKTDNFVVQEMFVEESTGDVYESSDRSVGCEAPQKENSLEDLDQGLDSCSFRFKLIDVSCPSNVVVGECLSAQDNVGYSKKNLTSEESFGECLMEDEALEEKDVSYEIKLLPGGEFSFPDSNHESDACGDDDNDEDEDLLTLNKEHEVKSVDRELVDEYDLRNWMSNFLEESDYIKPDNVEVGLDLDHTERSVDLNDEYIELEPQPLSPMHIVEEKITVGDASKQEGLVDGSKEQKKCWDSDTDDDEELDVLLEHQILVQQMKTELKNCRIRSLPPISEEEGEIAGMVEDLKPLEIEQRIEYRDVMEEIQKFYKSYLERMRKLDILNYQTLQAISFQQLKESDIYSAGAKRSCKGQRIYADPMHRSVVEMHRDLELVYVGQLCLSWEILRWLYAKAHELSGYDSLGNHFYNRTAEEFQQFQVVVWRFIEDEPFQGQRIQNYVRSRCAIRCLLQVPTIRDDYSKLERREESDAVSLEMLMEMIRESILIFREFLFADKLSSSIQEVRTCLHDSSDSMLFANVIASLHKKARKSKECARRQKCVVKKSKKKEEDDDEGRACEVELRLVSRVLRLSKLSRDQLVWCQKKLDNINFLGRKPRVDQSFLLFPS